MKLPVIKAVATTFAFTLENWLTLLRIIWAPYLVSFGLTIVFQHYLMTRLHEVLELGDSISYMEALGIQNQINFLNLCVNILTGLLSLMMSAGILRLVIHGDKPRFLYFRWTSNEWLLLGTVIVTFAIGWLIGFLFGVGMLAARGFIMDTPALAIILPIVFLLILLVLAVRVYLAFPAAIGRGEFGVGPAWSASSKQFFRLLAYLAIWVVLAILWNLAAIAIVAPDVLAAFYDAFTWGPEWITQFDLNMRIMESIDPTTTEGMLRLTGLWVFNLVTTVMGAIAMGVAWRMIDEKPPRPQGMPPVEGSASSVMGF